MIGVAIVIRVLHLGAAIALMGSWTFPLLIVRPALQQAGQRDWAAWPHFDRLLLRVGGWSLVGFGGASVLGFWDQCARVTQRSFVTMLPWAEVGSFLMDTRYGRVWLLRLLLAVLLGGVLFVSTRQHHGPSRELLRLAGAVLASGLLGAQSWTGHAAAAEGAELPVQIGLDVVHLVAAGVWLGGLPLLALLLTWAHRANQASAECIAAEATRRFSALGLGSVLLLVLTGMARAWGLVGSVPALLGTPYGQLLLGKVSLLLLLLLPATINVWYDKPFLLRMVAEQRRQQTHEALRRLRRNVLLEMVCGCALLVVVGGLGVYPPAGHVSPSWPLAFRLSWEATKDIPGVRSQVLLGGSVILISLLAVGHAIGGRRWRWPAAGGGVVGLTAGLWVVGRALAIDAYPTTYVRPTVPYQALSIAHGLRLYQEHCVVCHGLAGYGDGPAAATLRPRPANLTAQHTGHHTVGDLFWWLTYGLKGSAMPGFQDQLTEEERWDLINFVRTLAAVEQARPLGPRLEPEPWLVAPDFNYRTSAGDGQTLKDQRGRHSVLLVFFRLPGSQGRLAQLHDLAPHLQRLGSEVLAVPLYPEHAMVQQLDPALRVSLVTDGAAEAAMVYTLFRKSLSPAGRLPVPPIPSHLEFLIDRQGYIRSRWLPDSGPRWAEPDDLIAALEQLNHEKSRAPAPDEHVH
jgi:putative copper export protein/mono/diheme cytochrome c family protein/peroxiredoxin